ncbi:MAG: GAF domain-containing protein [Bacteroidetes bacterium HGW-Bacteroidetes-2]|jgi:hypothetical protein|nr:MAG: GAF domain-containing protein [Bacteroidetes bacterium HGW-Bacteroidetes-2]
MNAHHKHFPLETKISFHKIVEFYEEKLKDSSVNEFEKQYVRGILEYIKPFPELFEGISDFNTLKKYKDVIDVLLNDLFPTLLSSNEIKAITVPFQNFILHPSIRFSDILENAGKDFELQIRNFNEDFFFVMSCMLILKTNFGFDTDISRPVYYDIPDADGNIKNYRISYNADFIDILPTDTSVTISQEDIDLLLQDIDDISFWREKFPPKSWIFKGFAILNLTDVTLDNAISELKTTLLIQEKSEQIIEKFQTIFQSIFKIKDLRVGLTEFDYKSRELKRFDFLKTPNFILNENSHKDCETGLCPSSYKSLIEKHEYYVLTNVDAYAKRSNNNFLATSLQRYDVKSCILAPIAKEGKLIAVLELVSYRKNELNRINANKLEDVLPYIITALEKNKESYENKIKAVIQKECTSIHSNVLWVFEKEAKRYIQELDKTGAATFKDIVFENVYPLYGQIDINNSSKVRNDAIMKDLLEQLDIVELIFQKALDQKPIQIYEHSLFLIKKIKADLITNYNTSTEQKIVNFLRDEIHPILTCIEQISPEISADIKEYHEKIDEQTGVLYNHRKIYDETVSTLNKTIATTLDKKQKVAQKIYPHYFERYKTDGVDHNIYIGESMVNNNKFHQVYLQNLRLWQLQTMCEVENKFYEIQKKFLLPLDASSLILVYNNTLSIRYRMDEKRFDVDGTYNARYEIIKKRIDKANIKNTQERITQKGKIVIVYSNKSDEKEYKKYIHFLQSKKYVTKTIENFEVEDLQGVVGLKALRVEVIYQKNSIEKEPKKPLIKEIVSK